MLELWLQEKIPFATWDEYGPNIDVNIETLDLVIFCKWATEEQIELWDSL